MFRLERDCGEGVHASQTRAKRRKRLLPEQEKENSSRSERGEKEKLTLSVGVKKFKRGLGFFLRGKGLSPLANLFPGEEGEGGPPFLTLKDASGDL